jgi:hypothetical protein
MEATQRIKHMPEEKARGEIIGANGVSDGLLQTACPFKGGTGYQPVPSGNLPDGMGRGLAWRIKASWLQKAARDLPPGW